MEINQKVCSQNLKYIERFQNLYDNIMYYSLRKKTGYTTKADACTAVFNSLFK